jgi:hypothetical protein
MKDFQSFDSGSSPDSRIELPRTNRFSHSLRIIRPSRMVRLEGSDCMSLRLEQHPLKRPAHFDPSFGRGNLALVLKPFPGIFLGLDDDGLHLKM